MAGVIRVSPLLNCRDKGQKCLGSPNGAYVIEIHGNDLNGYEKRSIRKNIGIGSRPCETDDFAMPFDDQTCCSGWPRQKLAHVLIELPIRERLIAKFRCRVLLPQYVAYCFSIPRLNETNAHTRIFGFCFNGCAIVDKGIQGTSFYPASRAIYWQQHVTDFEALMSSSRQGCIASEREVGYRASERWAVLPHMARAAIRLKVAARRRFGRLLNINPKTAAAAAQPIPFQ